MDNSQQIEYWNGPSGQRWAALQDTVDRVLGPLTQVFVRFVAAKPGEQVLDIGCGCGTTTFTFAECVGREGSVAGVDISAPMLAVARARAAAAQADIPFIEADASAYDFQPVFDLVVSRFGVMFFADPIAAFANIRKALARQGRLAFVCWRAFAENGWMAASFEAARPYLPPQEPTDPNAPGPFAFADEERLRGILASAGYRGIHIEKFDGYADMGTTAEDATRISFSIGPLARAVSELDEATRAKIFAAVTASMAQFKTADGIRGPVACWFVRAHG